MVVSKKATVLSASSIASLPVESFEEPSRGEVSWRTLFTQPKTPTSDLSAGIAVCPSLTGHLCRHRHAQAEIYHILEGRGIVTVGAEPYEVEKGSAVFIPGDVEHSVVNNGEEPLKWFYIFPSGSFSDVIYRFSESRRSKL